VAALYCCLLVLKSRQFVFQQHSAKKNFDPIPVTSPKHVSKPETFAKEKPAGAPKRVEKALPQWFIDLVRPLVRAGSRLVWRLEHKGIEKHSRRQRGHHWPANHQSYGDPFWLSIPVNRPIRYLAWSEAFSCRCGKAIRLLAPGRSKSRGVTGGNTSLAHLAPRWRCDCNFSRRRARNRLTVR